MHTQSEKLVKGLKCLNKLSARAGEIYLGSIVFKVLFFFVSHILSEVYFAAVDDDIYSLNLLIIHMIQNQ